MALKPPSIVWDPFGPYVHPTATLYFESDIFAYRPERGAYDIATDYPICIPVWAPVTPICEPTWGTGGPLSHRGFYPVSSFRPSSVNFVWTPGPNVAKPSDPHLFWWLWYLRCLLYLVQWGLSIVLYCFKKK